MLACMARFYGKGRGFPALNTPSNAMPLLRQFSFAGPICLIFVTWVAKCRPV